MYQKLQSIIVGFRKYFGTSFSKNIESFGDAKSINAKKDSTLELLNKILIYALVFFTPLIFSFQTKEAFEFPKMIFVYAIGTTIVFLFAIDKILQNKPLINFGKVNKLILLFVAVNIVSFVFSSHHYTSLWGYYSRFNGGLVSVLIFFGIYIAAKNTLANEGFENIFVTFVLSSIFASLYGILQHFQLSPNIWNAEEAVRVFSTLGQPNWLAAYLTFIMPFTLYFFLNTNEAKKAFFGLIFILNFASLWFTYSLSGMTALIFLTLVFTKLNLDKIKQNFKPLLALSAVCLLIAVFQPGVWKARLEDVFLDLQKVSAQEVLEQQVVQDPSKYNLSDTGSIRTGLWKGTVALIFSSPKVFLIGTGPETYAYEFQPFRPTELNYTSEWDFIFNKPHNYYLELWANIGIMGLSAHLGLLYFIFTKKGKASAAAITAFAMANLFGWPTVATTLYFWLVIAGNENS